MIPLDIFTPRPDGWTQASWLSEQRRRRAAIRVRRALCNRALPMAREEELEAIDRYIAEHGVKRVTLDRQGNVRIRTVKV